MIEVLTNPITLLCLGIVFLLIALLFFYFKRSLSLLERAQMEQAKVLQSFITNMEMSQHQNMMRHHQMMTQTHMNNNKIDENDSVIPLIDVSDDGNATDEDSGDSGDGDDSDSGDSDGDDSGDSVDHDSDNENDTNNRTPSRIPIIEVDELQNDDNEIKVIELQEISLEEIYPEIMNIDKLNNSDDNNDENDSDDSDSDSDSDSDINNSDDDVVKSGIYEGDNIKNTIKPIGLIEINKKETDDNVPNTDLKTLNVQTLRKMAEEAHIIEAGDKKTKKELISLLANK